MSITPDSIIVALKASQQDLRAENARLQERVEEFERQSKAIGCCAGRVVGYKALAERRGEALRRIAVAPSLAWQVGAIARAAIDAEEAREKERR